MGWGWVDNGEMAAWGYQWMIEVVLLWVVLCYYKFVDQLVVGNVQVLWKK